MKLVDRIANAEVSFSSYIIAISSAAFGLIALGILLATDALDNNPFIVGLFLGGFPWSVMLSSGSMLVIYGLLKRQRQCIRYGAIMAFAMWVFAGISFGMNDGIVTILVVVIPDATYFAYIYLAASIKVFNGVKK